LFCSITPSATIPPRTALSRDFAASKREEFAASWTLYMMSLMFRNTETVKLIKDHVTELWDAGVKALEENYACVYRKLDSAIPVVKAAENGL
jgi:hypothetical protein